MRIHYVFSKNNKIGSRLISWASSKELDCKKECPSHMAILINEAFVLESTLTTGVRIIPYHKWLFYNTELARVPVKGANRSMRDILIDKWGAKYDWLGIAYFAYCYIKLILFKIPLPETNAWQNKNKMFCTEYASLLSGQDLSMKSPARVLKEWS